VLDAEGDEMRGNGSGRRFNFWHGVLTTIIGALVVQAVYGVNWAGKLEQRVATLEASLEGVTVKVERTAGIAVQNAAKLDAMEDRITQSNKDTTARLDRIENKLDRLIEQTFDRQGDRR
jgi:uncharacterized coiled-coil protein SlyX